MDYPIIPANVAVKVKTPDEILEACYAPLAWAKIIQGTESIAGKRLALEALKYLTDKCSAGSPTERNTKLTDAIAALLPSARVRSTIDVSVKDSVRIVRSGRPRRESESDATPPTIDALPANPGTTTTTGDPSSQEPRGGS